MAIITLEDVRNSTPDKYTGEMINEFRRDQLLDSIVFDDNAQQNGSSMFYTYNRIESLISSSFRKINERFKEGKTTTSLQSVELAIMGTVFNMDRVLIDTMINKQTAVSALDTQLRNAIMATRMNFSDAFFNSKKDETGAFDGIDVIAEKYGRVVNSEEPLDLRTDVNDGEFMTRVSKLITSLRAQGGIKRVIAFDEDALQYVFDRIAFNRSFITTSTNDLGQTVYSFKGAQFIHTGQASNSDDVIKTASDGTTSMYGVAFGQEATLAVTGFPEIFRLRVPNFENLPEEIVRVGVEAVISPVVKDTRSVAKLGNLLVQNPDSMAV